jgi:uncharacterized membrane protein
MAWGCSLLADAATMAGWLDGSGRLLAWYGILAGIVAMLSAAFVCGYDLQFQRETRFANAELLDSGVLLAAVLLFGVNAAWRLHSPESPLPPLLSFLGLAAVLVDLYVDADENGASLPQANSRH